MLKKTEEIDALAKQARELDLRKEIASSEIKSKEIERETKLKCFLDTLFPLSQDKQDVMNRVTQFLAEYLDIPAVYIGVMKNNGDSVSINYYSASPGQEHCIGKKIIKQIEDSEESQFRVGLSFDAFKVPELQETEEEVPEDEQKSRPIAKPVPIHIENVLRNPRIKFFGIPKLGAYVAIPLQYLSLDHENSCQLQINEETGEAKFVSQPMLVNLMIGMDTIGKYRRFSVSLMYSAFSRNKEAEIKIAETVGESMIHAFRMIEEKMYDINIQCINALKPLLHPVAESLEGLKSSEEEGHILFLPPFDFEWVVVAAAIAELSDEEKAEQSSIKDAVTRAAFWTQQIINVPISNGYTALRDYVFPLPAIYMNLFYCVGCLIGISPSTMKDPCGDLSWNAIKMVRYLVSLFIFP